MNWPAAVMCCVAMLPVSAAPKDRRLVWSDEFNGAPGAPPDLSKWAYDLGGGGWGNHELEVHTDSRSNSYLDGEGNLVIQALQPTPGHYTSARLKTQGKFSTAYGRVEARIKIPYGQGIWPAFWMLGNNQKDAGWPACGEIDIMENIGREPGVVHGTVHGPARRIQDRPRESTEARLRTTKPAHGHTGLRRSPGALRHPPPDQAPAAARGLRVVCALPR